MSSSPRKASVEYAWAAGCAAAFVLLVWALLPAAPVASEQAQTAAEPTAPPGMEWLSRPRPEDAATAVIRTDAVLFGVVMPPDSGKPGKYEATAVAVAASGQATADLTGYVVEDPEGKRTPLKKGQLIAFTLAGGSSAAAWKLLDSGGKVLGTAQIPLKPAAQTPAAFPKDPLLLQSNQAFTLTGNFGADPPSSQFRVNGQPASVVAIGPDSAVVACPDLGQTTGRVPVEVNVGGTSTTLPANALTLTVKGPTVMHTKEPGNLTVEISGLQGLKGASLQREIKATVQNDTPGVVELANHQTSYRVLINPKNISDAGTYSFPVPYSAAHVGQYKFTAAARQGAWCCDIACAPCSGTWFCSSKGIVQCSRGNCLGGCAGHSGGSACDKWFCSCTWRGCLCAQTQSACKE